MCDVLLDEPLVVTCRKLKGSSVPRNGDMDQELLTCLTILGHVVQRALRIHSSCLVRSCNISQA